MERNELQRKANAMKEQLQKLGYTQEQIEAFLAENKAKQKEMMSKGIRNIFFANSQFDIMPKAFN
jgi:hypothetical protein